VVLRSHLNFYRVASSHLPLFLKGFLINKTLNFIIKIFTNIILS
jgi:hypothetical protein